MTLSETTEQIASTHRKNSRKLRSMIKDNCDYCKHLATMYRSQLALRARGKKFGCGECYKTNPQCKADRAIPCYQSKD
jgi:hypothetical protein